MDTGKQNKFPHHLTQVTNNVFWWSRCSAFFCLMFSLCVAGVAPRFTFPPSDHTVTEGNTAVFTCQTSGAPKPAITWRKGSVPCSLHYPLSNKNTPTWCVCIARFAQWPNYLHQIGGYLVILCLRRIAGLSEWLRPGSQVHTAAVRWFADSASELPGFWRIHVHSLQFGGNNQCDRHTHRLE